MASHSISLTCGNINARLQCGNVFKRGEESEAILIAVLFLEFAMLAACRYTYNHTPFHSPVEMSTRGCNAEMCSKAVRSVKLAAVLFLEFSALSNIRCAMTTAALVLRPR